MAFLLLFIHYFQTNVSDVLLSVSKATMRSFSVSAVNDAVFYTMSDGVKYDDLISVGRDENGNVSSITANALKINRIARDTAALSQANLKNLSTDGIPIPLGAFTGVKSLAGAGKKIKIRIIPVCSVACVFSSAFESVGVNQTKHAIYLTAVCDVNIVMPRHNEHFAVSSDILIAECVLVGKVPDSYLQADLFQKTTKPTE